MDTASELLRHMQDLRATWQGRVLEHAKGRMMLAVCSMLADAYDEAMPVLLRVVKPACWDAFNQTLIAPFLCSSGKVDKAGRIIADAIVYNGAVKTTKVLFANESDFQSSLRTLADRLKLSDQERREFFAVAKKWVVCDYRLDPTMDPQDPDAKRLTVN